MDSKRAVIRVVYFDGAVVADYALADATEAHPLLESRTSTD